MDYPVTEEVSRLLYVMYIDLSAVRTSNTLILSAILEFKTSLCCNKSIEKPFVTWQVIIIKCILFIALIIKICSI